jgi:hypothetical protein
VFTFPSICFAHLRRIAHNHKNKTRNQTNTMSGGGTAAAPLTGDNSNDNSNPSQFTSIPPDLSSWKKITQQVATVLDNKVRNCVFCLQTNTKTSRIPYLAGMKQVTQLSFLFLSLISLSLSIEYRRWWKRTGDARPVRMADCSHKRGPL